MIFGSGCLILTAVNSSSYVLVRPVLIAAELSSKVGKMLNSVKLLTKYVIIIYALGSLREKFGV